jgi:hypothetical protein
LAWRIHARIQGESTKRRVKPGNQKTFAIIISSDGWQAGKERPPFMICGISAAAKQPAKADELVQKWVFLPVNTQMC